MRALVLVALLGACDRDRDRASEAVPDPPALRVDASDLIAKFECNRCHEIAGIAAAAPAKHCVTCHQQIHAGTFAADAPILERWRARITSILAVPSLAHADRLRRAWIRSFLLKPHDVRPGLVAEMPRLALTADEAERLAAHLAGPDEPDKTMGPGPFILSGAQLYRSLACGRCHRFTGASVDDAALHAAGKLDDRSWQLAPDLRHARMRMTARSIARWIEDPRGAMPKLAIASADARALAAFITTTPLAGPPPGSAIQRLPVLARAVTWDEVETKVFRNVCWHCHAVPDFARGDGGPGNSGGFGFVPRGLDLSSYAGISAGSLDDAGERRSVFAPLADGTPRIVAHLLARHTEAAGGIVDGVRGMPLGLPPLPLDEIQLVETWIAQGRPR